MEIIKFVQTVLLFYFFIVTKYLLFKKSCGNCWKFWENTNVKVNDLKNVVRELQMINGLIGLNRQE